MVQISDWEEPFILMVKYRYQTLMTFGGTVIGVHLWNFTIHFNLAYTKFKSLVKNGVVMEQHLQEFT